MITQEIPPNYTDEEKSVVHIFIQTKEFHPSWTKQEQDLFRKLPYYIKVRGFNLLKAKVCLSEYMRFSSFKDFMKYFDANIEPTLIK